jgi:hypothetical protein
MLLLFDEEDEDEDAEEEKEEEYGNRRRLLLVLLNITLKPSLLSFFLSRDAEVEEGVEGGEVRC